jgi:hypothetical protein
VCACVPVVPFDFLSFAQNSLRHCIDQGIGALHKMAYHQRTVVCFHNPLFLLEDVDASSKAVTWQMEEKVKEINTQSFNKDALNLAGMLNVDIIRTDALDRLQNHDSLDC